MLNKPIELTCQIKLFRYNYNMKNIFNILFLFFWISSSNAADILIKEGSAVSEIIIKVPANLIKNYKVDGSVAEITFNKKFNLDLKQYNKKVITDILKKDNTLLIKGNPWATIYIANERDQLRVVIANTPKTVPQINVTVNKAIPFEDQTYKNEDSEKMLRDIKAKMSERNFDKALVIANKLIEKNPLDKYGEEALYLTGVINIELGKDSDKALFAASSIFDEFLRKFPKSRLLGDAYLKSAEVKEKLGFKNEAIYTYQELIKNTKDERYIDIAYTKIGQLYKELGQPDRALKYFTDYIQKNKPENSPIYGYIGSIYAQKGDFKKAFEYFSKYKPKKIEDISPEIVYWMGETLYNQNDHENALKYFTTLYNKFPDYEKTDIAMYKSALILLEKDKKDLAIKLLKDTKLKYPQKMGGLLSAIKIAEDSLDSNDSAFWAVYLADVINNNIDPDLALKGIKLLTIAYLKDKKYKEALKEISLAEAKFSTLPEFKEFHNLKEDIQFEMIKSYYTKGDFKAVETGIDKFIQGFPNSNKIKELLYLKEEISYNNAKKLYDAKRYQDAIKSITQYLTANKNLTLKEKWYQLWEAAFYLHIMNMKNDPVKFGLNGKEFIILFPSSPKVNEIKEIISKNLLTEFNTLVKNKDYVNIIKFFQDNRGDIDKHPQREYFLSHVGYALFMLGDKDRAISIIKNIKYVSKETELIKMVANIKPNRFNINNYNLEKFKKIIEELMKIDRILAYQNALAYRNNRIEALKTAASILEQMTSGQKKPLIRDFIQTINREAPSLKKDAYNVYFEYADSLFMDKKYKEAIENYLTYLTNAPQNDPKRVDALYFTGKSYLNTGNKDLSAKYFNELVSKYPTSQYANLAKSELEDLKWKSMKR